MEGSPGCRPRESVWWADRKEGDTDVPSEHLYVPFRIPPFDIWVAYHGYTHYRDEKTEVHLGGVNVIHLIHSFILTHSTNTDEKLLHGRNYSWPWGHSGHQDRYHLCLVGSCVLVGETKNAVIQVEKQIIMGPRRRMHRPVATMFLPWHQSLGLTVLSSLSSHLLLTHANQPLQIDPRRWASVPPTHYLHIN